MPAYLAKALVRLVREEDGGYLVEFAIVFPTMIMLSIGLLEFSLLAYDFQRASEATRRAVRFAIIGNSVANTANLLLGNVIQCTSSGGVVSCTGGSPSETADERFQEMLTSMQVAYPLIYEEHLRITYESTNVGDEDEAGGIIPLVTIEVVQLKHEFMLGKLIGMDFMYFPAFRTSVLGSGRTVNASSGPGKK